jgi:class 3 adenylate cyclase
MSEEEIERKIAVIFATDVVGYSKHMEADESSTIKNLRACEKILTALFEKHKGRLFNTGGDSFLAEFSSAVSAVECAVEFQKAIKDRNSSDDTSVKLEFRIGINSGDVVKEKENLLGDGVNIACKARRPWPRQVGLRYRKASMILSKARPLMSSTTLVFKRLSKTNFMPMT